MNTSYLSSVKNTILVSKPSTTIRMLLMVLFVCSFANVASAQTCNGISGTVSSNTANMCVGGPTEQFWSSGWSGGIWSSSNPAVLTAVKNSSNANATVTAISAGTADVIYTYKQAGCPDKVSIKTVTVGSAVGSVSADQSICTGSSLTSDITISSTTGTVQWKRADNAAFTTNVTNVGLNSTTLTIAQVGTLNATKYFRAEVTGGTCGSGTSGIVTVTVSPNLLTSVAIAASPSGAICSGTSVTFTATPTNGGTTPTYQWYNGTTPISGATSATYTTTTLANGNAIKVIMISNASPCLSGSPATSNAITATVNATLSAPTVGTTTQPTCTTATGSVVLNGLPSGSWMLTRSPGNITTTGTGTSTTISGLTAGTTYTYFVNSLNNGLKGEYYNNKDLTGSPILTRTDATVGFDWGSSSPDPSIGVDNFSVRWSGLIQPLYSEAYTFSTRSDDGIRLWVNGVQVINNWTDHSVATNTGTITLTAGIKYDIVLEYYENSGSAVSQLSWSSPRQVSQIISQSQLYPDANCGSPVSANVVINAQPATPAVPIGTASQSFCAINNPTVANLSATGTTIKWYAAASGGSALTTTTVLVNGAHYFATQTLGGCESSTRFDVTATVNANLLASVVIAASPSGAICSGTSVTFTATPTNGGTTPIYQWKLNGADVGTNSATYANSGLVNGNTVTCVMTSNASPCVTGSPATSNTITAIVNATPTITGTVTPATCSNGTDGAITITGLNVPIEFKKADNDYIDLGSKLLSNRNSFTVEGWVKFNLADVGSRMSLFGQNDVIEFFLDGNTIQLYTAGGGSVNTPLTAAFGNNTWHHIAATGDGTNLRIYIDGSLVVTGGTTTTNYGNSTTYNAQIGSGVVDPLTLAGGGFTGQIGKVGFYNSALIPATITNLAASPTTYLGTETGLIAGYNFFEGSGTALTKLPAGTNGTFGNSPQWAYTSYTWTKTGTPSYTAPTKNISGLSPGDYNLTISTLGGGCPITKTFTVGSTNTTPSIPTVEKTTQPDCVNGGSVVLSGLPASGTWTVTRSPGAVATSGTGTSTTISGLAVGSYTFTVTNGTCTSSATAIGSVVINAAVTNTWNGASWDNGTPTATQALVFNGDYPPASDPNVDISGCSCTINTGKNVTIKAGRNLIITNAITVSGGTLTFEDTASLVQTNNAAINSGNITYKRTSSSALTSDYTYWSSPVVNQSLNISLSYASGMFYSYDDFATPEGWKKETAATIMQIGKGYIIRGPQITSPPPPPGLYYAAFYGIPNNGTKTIAIGPTGTSNLLGNPYPSAINADTFLSANSAFLEGTLYFWTHNTAIQIASNIESGKAGSGVLAYTSDDYASYNGTGGVAVSGGIIPTGKIAAGQAFFTTSKATGATVTYNNTMRLAGTTLADKTGVNQQFFKTKTPNAKTENTIEKNRIWLDLSNDQGAFKQTLVGYITDATNDYDSRFDGESFDGNDFVDFYSVNNDKNLVIQGRALPFDENDTVPLGFKSTIDGDFTINIDETDGLLASQTVFIEDKLTNTVTDLKSGNYTFNTVAGTFNDRFVLRYTNKTLSIDETDKEDGILVLYSNNYKTLIIHNNEMFSTVNSVVLFNITGQNIANWEVNDSEQTNIQIPIKNVSSGIYIVKVKTTKGESSKKIIVK